MFIPIENNGNSALPTGDQIWVSASLDGTNSIAVGGRFDSGNQAGPFAYICDTNIGSTSRSIGARLMFIPTKNDTYYNNINAWKGIWEGV